MNSDSHTLFYRRQLTCHITGRTPAFEPIKTNILIQTTPDIDYVAETARFLEWHEHVAPDFPLPNKTRVRWIREPMTYYADSAVPKPFYYEKYTPAPESEKDREIDDIGTKTAFAAFGALGKRKKRELNTKWDGLSYLSFPSIMSDDPTCKRRTQMKLSCHNLYGNIEVKLAFFTHVHLDPSGNSQVFRAPPLTLKGIKASQTRNMRRRKRQVTAGVFLLAAGLSAFASSVSGLSVEVVLENKIRELQDKFNVRFSKDEENLRRIATKVNTLQTSGIIRDQAINRILINQLKQQALDEVANDYLQKQITENRRLIVNNLGLLINITVHFRNITLQEAELNRLVITQLKNSSGTALFDQETVYLGRLSEGALALTPYAQRIYRRETEEANEQTQRNHRFSSELHKQYHDLARSENESIIQIRIDENRTVHLTPFNISSPDWNPQNVTVIGNKTLLDILVHGISQVPSTIKTLADDGIKIVHGGLSTPGKTLLGVLIPTAIIVIAAVILKKTCNKTCKKDTPKATPLDAEHLAEMLAKST